MSFVFLIECGFDNRGNMSYREDIHKNLKESFGYDALDRLERIGYHVNGNHQLYLDRYIEYDNGGIGNISSITGTGSGFNYGENGAGPHALTSVSRPEPGWRPGPQEIKYTAFNKASSIIDTVSIGRALSYDIHYGLDDQRHKSVFKDSGQVIRTKYYFGDYEKINENSETKNYHYISSPTGLCAIFVKDDQGGQVQLWHTYTDHLGSLVYMVNADNANDYKEYSYDAWGNPRDAEDWTQPATENLFAARGFTGHEHLEEFALINMNGRIYDPMLGRFFSPDPYVQLPGYAGSYNRYSYCLNNPLIYTDPSGEFIFTVLASVIPGAQFLLPLAISTDIGWMTGGMNSVASGGTFRDGAWKGAVTGAISGTTSYLGVPGIIPGGLVQSGASVGVNGITNLLDGDKFFDNWGMATISGFSSGAYSGYKLSDAGGLNYWWGTDQSKWGYNRDQWSLALWDKPDKIVFEEVKNRGAGQTNCMAKSFEDMCGNTEAYWDTYINSGDNLHTVRNIRNRGGHVMQYPTNDPNYVNYDEILSLDQSGGRGMITFDNY